MVSGAPLSQLSAVPQSESEPASGEVGGVDRRPVDQGVQRRAAKVVCLAEDDAVDAQTVLAVVDTELDVGGPGLIRGYDIVDARVLPAELAFDVRCVKARHAVYIARRGDHVEIGRSEERVLISIGPGAQRRIKHAVTNIESVRARLVESDPPSGRALVLADAKIGQQGLAAGGVRRTRQDVDVLWRDERRGRIDDHPGVVARGGNRVVGLGLEGDVVQAATLRDHDGCRTQAGPCAHQAYRHQRHR